MDVSKWAFPTELVNIIQQIADSHFVAFDLEFTGIAGRSFQSGGKDLQQVYSEVRDAANRYQVLQFGMTIATEDWDRGVYILKTYNFYIDPVPARYNLKLERIWSFQSGAVEFLNRHDFDFGKPYREGVSYLTRQEANSIRGQGPEVYEDLPLKTEDAELLDAVRQAISTWISTEKDVRTDSLNLPPEKTAEDQQTAFPLSFNRYQMRLVYQTVRNEFSTKVVAIGKKNWMQIIQYDHEREERIRAQQIASREREINTSTEFRWIVEALAGGDITGLEKDRFGPTKSSTFNADEESDSWQEMLNHLQTKIKSKHRILIGHNLFTDLVNLYKCFIGDLPESVEDFQHRIHNLFPTIIDTKYMAKDRGKSFEYSPLEELEWRLRDQTAPATEIPREFGKYNDEAMAHEAGYDSLMTAKAAIKLSTRTAWEEACEAYPQIMTNTESKADSHVGNSTDGFQNDSTDVSKTLESDDSVANSVKTSVVNAISAPVEAVKFLVGAKKSETSKFDSSLPPNLDTPKEKLYTAAKRAIDTPTQPAPATKKPINWTDQSAVEALRKAFSQSRISSVLRNGGGGDDKGATTGFDNRSSSSASPPQQTKASTSLSPSSASRAMATVDDRGSRGSSDLLSFSSASSDGNHVGDEEDGNDESGEGEDDLRAVLVMMPAWDGKDGYWDRVRNRLRVNACNEGVCVMGGG
ncbi:MAG: hypothetical protein Q9227_003193 [Pyrenula ochraceoflavens]